MVFTSFRIPIRGNLDKVSQNLEMEGKSLKVSDWVHAFDGAEKLTGFVVAFAPGRVVIQTTIPKNYGAVIVPTEDVMPADDTIWLDDIPALIDLALMIRDREWFQKWVHELSMWKSVEEINHLF
jgi:hypothetical protein